MLNRARAANCYGASACSSALKAKPVFDCNIIIYHCPILVNLHLVFAALNGSACNALNNVGREVPRPPFPLLPPLYSEEGEGKRVSAQFSSFQPLADFEERLPLSPYYGESKRIDGIVSRDRAADYAYIQVNFPLIHYLAFDCDSHDAAIRPAEMGLPGPTLSVITPDTGRAHLLYQLLQPIPRRRKSGKTSSLLRDVMAGYTTILEADKCITTERQLVKNPLSREWRVLEGHKPFSLSELMEYVPQEIKRESKSEIPGRRIGGESLAQTRARMALDARKVPDSRNCCIFENARFYAYRVVADHSSYESLLNAVLDYIEDMNEKQVPDHFPGKGKILKYGELRSTAKSIAGYTFAKRSQFSKVDRGAMGFQPLEELHLKGKEYEAELRRRSSLSAQHTNRKRKEATREKIKCGVHLCIKHGIDVKPDNIATLGQVSRRAVYNYMQLIRELTQKESFCHGLPTINI